MRIVILGGGFGGLNAAVNLSKYLQQEGLGQVEVIVISQSPDFLFRPSLIWVAFGKREPEQLQFPIAPVLEKAGIIFKQAEVVQLLPNENRILLKDLSEVAYDFLIIATGAVPDWQSTANLQHVSASLYTLEDALRTKQRIEALTHNSQITVGVLKPNPLPAIAYEFAFELDAFLKEKQIPASIRFFTFETRLLELAGTKASALAEKHMHDKTIAFRCNARLTEIKSDKLDLSNGESWTTDLALILPPYRGAEWMNASNELEHEHGLLTVNPYLQVTGYDRIYAIGDAALLHDNFMKNGRTAELQGKYVAKQIAVRMTGKDERIAPFKNHLLSMWELGSDGALMAFKYPVNMDGSGDDMRYLEWAADGKMIHMMKRAFEKYYMLKFS